MTKYVAGFLFLGGYVALIRKNKPEWQVGKLNGIGGKVEEGETPEQAMEREFKEEAGLCIEAKRWRMYCVIVGKDFEVAFFTCTLEKGSKDVALISITDEIVDWYHVMNLDEERLIKNLKWLIPLAQDTDAEGTTVIWGGK